MTVSVILPTLNEADNIVSLLEAIRTHLPDVHEILVVDDDSPDGTASRVAQYQQMHPGAGVLLVKRTDHPGLTASLRDGILRATGDVVVWMDCDFSMPPEKIPMLLQCVEQGYDIAVGSRFVRGGSFKRNTEGTADSVVAVVLSRMMNYTIQLLLDHSFKDYTSGFIAARKHTLEQFPLRGDYGEYFIDYIFRALRRGYRIIEVPYVCLPRLRGESKTGQSMIQFIRRGWRYVWTALRLRWESLWQRRFPVRYPLLVHQRDEANPLHVEVRSMQEEDVPLVAGLHHQVLHQTLNSRLGIPFLEDLYGSLLTDDGSQGWVAFQGLHLIGFVSVSRNLHRTERHVMRAMCWRDRLVAMIRIMTSWRDLREYLSHQMFCRYVRRFANPYPTLLTLGVAPFSQGTGVAGQLMSVVKDYFRQHGVARYYVDTRHDNRRALAFYSKLAFSEKGRCAGNVVLEALMPLSEHVHS